MNLVTVEDNPFESPMKEIEDDKSGNGGVALSQGRSSNIPSRSDQKSRQERSGSRVTLQKSEGKMWH